MTLGQFIFLDMSLYCMSLYMQIFLLLLHVKKAFVKHSLKLVVRGKYETRTLYFCEENFPASHLALYLTTPPGIIIIMMLSVVTLWKLPCLALTKYESGIHIRSITVLLRNMVLLSP